MMYGSAKVPVPVPVPAPPSLPPIWRHSKLHPFFSSHEASLHMEWPVF